MDNQYFEWQKISSIPISALQHYIYCPRQFALIHIEEIYEENVFTIQGNIVHKRVDNEKNYYNKDKKVENSLPLWSEKYGLYGVADTVEFEGDRIIPVEFKSGKKKKKLADDIQLAAQAICLEEMFSKEITSGYIYYDKSRKRREVVLDEKLRKKLTDTISSVRELLISKNTPQPVNDQRCNNCSLKDYCLPDLASRIENYLKELK